MMVIACGARRTHGQVLTYEAVESLSTQKLVVRIADPKLPFGGSWTYVITPQGAGSTLTITENGEVYNPVFRLVSRFIIGQSSTLDVYMKALQNRLDEVFVAGRDQKKPAE